MSIADVIISRRMPDFDHYLQQGDSLDDIDEYGFTPLIECAITGQPDIATALLHRKVDINKPDVTGRTALHWAVDNNDIAMTRLLLDYGANANAYTRNGLSVLVYPLLRGQNEIKQMLYDHGAKLEFAQDFILGKLLGHRFELTGDVDIVTATGDFIELDYEGFILEFTVAIVQDSLWRFTNNYSTRHLRSFFAEVQQIMYAFADAGELLLYQQQRELTATHRQRIKQLYKNPCWFSLPQAVGMLYVLSVINSGGLKLIGGKIANKKVVLIFIKLPAQKYLTNNSCSNFSIKSNREIIFIIVLISN